MKMKKLAKEIYKARFKGSPSKKAKKRNAKFIERLYEVGDNPDMLFDANALTLENIKINQSTIHITSLMKAWMVDYLYEIFAKVSKDIDPEYLEDKKDFVIHFNSEDDIMEIIMSNNGLNISVDDGSNAEMIDAEVIAEEK